MPDKNVLEEIQREVKSFGDSTKALKESLEKDLADVRKIAEEAKKGVETPELKAQIDAFTLSVQEKHDAIEKAAKANQEQVDKLETAFKRSPSGKGAEDDGVIVKDAMAFYDTKAAATGNLAWRNRATDETVDIDGYKAWVAEFGTYLRANDERELSTKALSAGSNPNGGYLVPTAQSAMIVSKIFESSPLRQLATVETIGTDSIEISVDTGDAATGWVGEIGTRAATATPDVGTQKISVHEVYAKQQATQKFLEDASINVEAWLADKTADKMARTEATAFVSGTGVNQPRGILTYTAGSAGARSTILQYNSGSATLITADAVLAMPYQIKSDYMANAVWLMKRSTVMAVMLLKDGQGQYIWRPGLATGQPSTLAGYNIQPADDMPAVAAGTLPVAFGDFRHGYRVVDRLGITTLRDPFSAKPFVEFYSRKRVGGDVVDFEAFALMVVSA